MKHAFDTNHHRHFLLLLSCLALAFNPTAPIQGADDAPGLADELIRTSGLKRGLCAVLGIDGELPLQLAQASEMLIHVRDPRSQEVHALRERADGAKLGIHRLTAETGGFARLPYADNTIDLVIASQISETTLKELPVSEVLRVLRPEGIALLGNRSAGADRLARQLQDWAGGGGVRSRVWSTRFGQWIQIKKPELAGADDWSHWEKAPDNNPVSNDQVIKAPYMTQFLADPLYIGMPSITTAAGGRTFLAVGHISHHEREWGMLLKLIARNGYNGQVLWQRDLPEGYAVHRSAFIATKETFYMINGDHCLMLDAQTGAEQGAIRLPEVKGEWKWMALHNGVLYALLGKPEPGVKTMKGDRSFGGWSWADLSEDYYAKRLPFGFGDTLAAFDLKSKELRWMHKDEHLIDARGMAIQGNRIFLYAPDHYLRCLTADTGSQRWINDDKEMLGLIEAPGQGLRSTPGFRTACLVVASPGALVIQGQTRMNVIGVSTENGRLLWTKPKITNNPNALFVDGRFILGVGQNGSHVAIDPATGDVAEDFKFLKAACTRLTASTDSFFCRGEGTLRFDRASKKLQIDGTARPACNDGALPANGMLYIGPWQCDCNLSIIGHLGRCSAGDFRFDRVATDAERLQRVASDFSSVKAFPTTEKDWPTYRANDHRSASSPVPLAQPANVRWQYTPGISATPTAPTAAGDLIFSAGQDGKVRAIDAGTGALRWEHLTPAPIKQPPTIWEGRAYVGSGDGHVYALEAATGRLLWRFRAAPVERHLMVYGNLCSTWPVNSGVLVHDGVAYFAAGMIDHDGTCVYALDARTGALKWQNNSSGHLNPELRKGVSAQGNLTIQGGHLLLAGGNVVSPARFDLKTGKCLAAPPQQGRPSANSGQFVGVFRDQTVIAGGRILYSSPRNVSNKNGFDAEAGGKRFRFSMGGIPPAWNDAGLVYVNSMFGKLNYCEAGKVAARIEQGYAGDSAQRDRPPQMITLAQSLERKGELRWQSASGEKFEVLSLAVCPNAIVGVVRFQEEFRSQAQWWLTAFAPADGRLLFRQELTTEPLPGGLLIDRRGQAVVSMLNGELWCLGPRP